MYFLNFCTIFTFFPTWRTISLIFSTAIIKIKKTMQTSYTLLDMFTIVWETFNFAHLELSLRTYESRAQFHQRSMFSFYAHRSQKRKISVKSSVSFYAVGIRTHKSCEPNIDEIDTRSQFYRI